MNEKPNIILILADDLGYGDVSCMDARSGIHTANIDRLASEGMIMADCHASSALCTPSRYGLLTGRYNWRSRLKCSVLPGQSSHLIEEGRETLASLLKKQGYITAAVGKWHLGMDWKTKNGYELPFSYFEKGVDGDSMMNGIDFDSPVTNGPNAVGFDYFYGMPASLDQPPFVHMENDRVLNPPTRMIGVPLLHRNDDTQQFEVEYGPAEEDFDPRRIVPEMDRKVLELVDAYADADAPFFLYYPTLAVHGPLVPSEEYAGTSGLNAYADFVLQLDGFVGKLDALLEQKGIKEDTLVIFTSDNGCSPVAGFPELISKGHNPSSIFRGLKGDIWEGGHRIPFVVRWPGHIRPGTSSTALACLTDLFSSFAEITGAAYGDNAGEDSVSLLPIWMEQEAQVRTNLVHHSGGGRYSLRDGDWKMEFCRGAGNWTDTAAKEDGSYQLYNLRGDITEQTNLFGRFPEMEQHMLELTASFVRNGRSTSGKPQENSPNPFWPGLDFMK